VELDLSPQVLRIEVEEPTQHRDPNSIQIGDTIEVTAEKAPLKIEQKVLATVLRGQRLPVTRVNGEWLETSVFDGGEAKRGC